MDPCSPKFLFYPLKGERYVMTSLLAGQFNRHLTDRPSITYIAADPRNEAQTVKIAM